MKIVVEERKHTGEVASMFDKVRFNTAKQHYDNGSVEFLKTTVIPKMESLMQKSDDGHVSVQLCDDYKSIGSVGTCNWAFEHNHLEVKINMGLVYEPSRLFDVVCHELIHAHDFLSGKLTADWYGYSYDGVMYKPSEYRSLKHHQLPWEKVPNRIGKILGKYWDKVFSGQELSMTAAMVRPFA